MRFVPDTVHGRSKLDLWMPKGDACNVLDLWMSKGDACGKVWKRPFIDLNKDLFPDFETTTPTK